ncbi:MAG: FG-GAP-like repeat-containing protein [Candidatus Krumholzibacteriia bacterium]
MRAMAAIATGLAFLLAQAPATLASPASGVPVPHWCCITREPVDDIQIDSAGRLWATHRFTGLTMWPDGCADPSEALSEPLRFPPPQGTTISEFFVGAGGQVTIVTWIESDRTSSLFHREVGSDPSSPWRPVPLPELYGRPTALVEDSAGDLWLGAERRESFRFTGVDWVRHMAPVPYHFVDFVLNERGELFALSGARLDHAVLRWDGTYWRTEFQGTSLSGAEFLRVFGRTMVLGLDKVLYRRALGLNEPLEVWAETGSPTMAPATPDTAWVCRDGRLFLLAGQNWQDKGPLPLLPGRIEWLDRRLYAWGQTGLWVMDTAAETSTVHSFLGLAPRHDDTIPGEPPLYGMAVLDLPQGPHLYLPFHESPDAVAPLDPLASFDAWRQVSERLGLALLDESNHWVPSFDMAAVAGDLDGDDHEDVLLATMYDGIRFLRSFGGRRLAPWSGPAGLRGLEDEICEDVDLLDADGDGDLDLHVAALQGPDHLFLNDGAAFFHDATASSGMITPDASTSALCRDLDADGDTDIVVATSGRGLYIHENRTPRGGPLSFRTTILFADHLHPELPDGLSDLQLTGIEALDFDGDGDFDLLVGSRSGPALCLRNEGGLRFTEDPAVFAGEGPRGVIGITAMDPDGDGDWDLACTGDGGSRFYENRGEVLHLHADPLGRVVAPTRRSTGAVLVDTDGDFDLDYIEAYLDEPPVVYTNTNPPGGLSVRVRGPWGNPGALGAVVRVSPADHPDTAAAVQEIAGGSGYASHRTRQLVFTGLDGTGTYQVQVALPSGAGAVLSGVPGRGQVAIDMRRGGAAGLADAVIHRARRTWLDPWTRLDGLVSAGIALLVLALGLTQRRRYPGAIPWLAAGGLLTVQVLTRRLLPPVPGIDHAAITALAGLGSGLLVLAVARPRRSRCTVTLLAEFSESLKSFDHNQTPRKVIDRLQFVRTNAGSAGPGAPIAELLREDLDLFGGVVLPEFGFLMDGARAAEFDTGPGSHLLRSVTRGWRHLAGMSDDELVSAAGLPVLDALLDNVASFRAWTAALRREVDARLTTDLAAFANRYVHTRSAIHPVDIEADLPPIKVRIAEAELMRVLDSLLENAVRAADGRRAKVLLRSFPAKPGRIRLAISDDGPGLPAGLADTAFDAGVTATSGGTGYGLFAVRRTVERYGGRVLMGHESPGALILIELDTVT